MKDGIKTKWFDVIPPYGSIDDNVYIIDTKNNCKFNKRKDEFDLLGERLYELYDNKKIKYIQILKIWNEAIDFDEDDNIIIDDVNETIMALQQLSLSSETDWGKLSQNDLNKLIPFLENLSEFKLVED